MSGLSRFSRVDCSRLPQVLLIGAVAKLRRCLVSTIRRGVRSRDFPVAPLPNIDKRKLRWSAAAVCDWIDACNAPDASATGESAP